MNEQKVYVQKGDKPKIDKQPKPDKQVVEKKLQNKQFSGKTVDGPVEGVEPGNEVPQKSKAELKAERRAKQVL